MCKKAFVRNISDIFCTERLLHVTFQTFNPKLNIDNDITFYEASDSEIQKSVELAFQAFKKYKLVSSVEKSKFLNLNLVINIYNFIY